ncbi:MAG: toprim domain-containing protein, partial [Chloroflexota bacterium]|nr:toprim domain-containing protein [Chloroflexota bacterium]
MKLVIVESPTKAKSLRSFLGGGYRVLASMGHVRDLPPKKLGVDVEHGFRPTYHLRKGARKVIKRLRET